jgi:hypothetical protein
MRAGLFSAGRPNNSRKGWKVPADRRLTGVPKVWRDLQGSLSKTGLRAYLYERAEEL